MRFNFIVQLNKGFTLKLHLRSHSYLGSEADKAKDENDRSSSIIAKGAIIISGVFNPELFRVQVRN